MTAILFGAGLFSVGHDSPTHRIEALSDQIEAEGMSAALLIDRGFEDNALGDWFSAVPDFEAALKLSPGSWAALSGCAEACFQLGRWDQVASLAHKGLECQETPAMKAPFYALLARALMEQHHWEQASEAWDGALRSPSPEIDWYLGQSKTLANLGDYERQVRALTEARQRNPSVVLFREWIRTLVDTGQFDDAMLEIEKGIFRARWKSSWLLLRARVHGACGRIASQKADAQAAFSEIQARFVKTRPDPHLVKEAAQALAWMGERKEALAFVDTARRLGVSESELSSLTGLSLNNP